MRALANFRTHSIAIVTILAMLIVPACGSLCASMNHCSSSAESAEPEACHHANMSAQSDSGALSSSASCGQQAPLLAVLAASDSSVQLESEFAANPPYSIDSLAYPFALAVRSDEFPSTKESPQQIIPLENLSVLRT
jgi:hypothetical protein